MRLKKRLSISHYSSDSNKVILGVEIEEGSEFAQAAIFEVIENQIRDDNPCEVKQTIQRLLSEGHSKEEAMKLIGCALAVEIFETVKQRKPFNESRYVENLNNLPEIPCEDDEKNGI